jgi:hypothetical protein
MLSTMTGSGLAGPQEIIGPTYGNGAVCQSCVELRGAVYVTPSQVVAMASSALTTLIATAIGS